LEDLARLDSKQAQIVELRYFAGLTAQEVADVLKISPATVKREWATARVWLHHYMSGLSEADGKGRHASPATPRWHAPSRQQET